MSNYTIEEGLAVLEETKRLLAEDDRRRPDFRTARAAATTPPPTDAESGVGTTLLKRAAQYVFADEILKHMELGSSLADATREAAVARPDLHKEFVRKENELMAASEQKRKDAAAQFRIRNS